MYDELAAPFDKVHWRAQSVSNKNPNAPKAMALAFIDARDVMERFDKVCGPAGWQDYFDETPTGRVLCRISLRIEDEWIAKTDGAGSTAVEGDKGGISDAFKRAAVKWGVGRYLYDMPTPWVECELYNGKFSKWTKAGQEYLDKLARGGRPSASVAELPAPKINDAQVTELQGLLTAAQIQPSIVLETFKIKSLDEMTVPQWNEAVTRTRNEINKRKVG